MRRLNDQFRCWGSNIPGMLHYGCKCTGYFCHIIIITLLWRHNERDSVSNHQLHDYLLNRLFRRRSRKTSKLRVTGLCAGHSPKTGDYLIKTFMSVPLLLPRNVWTCNAIIFQHIIKLFWTVWYMYWETFWNFYFFWYLYVAAFVV